jgi:hypothetical protein
MVSLFSSRRAQSLAAAAAAILVVLACSPACAALRTFTIDAVQSQIVISGTTMVGDLPVTVQEQAAGSLTAHYMGSILTDVAPGTIQFVSGSVIDANVSGNWAPLATGAAGTAPADYGAHLEVT